MAFSRSDAWVWDFWLADDGDRYHMYYLFAPRSLGDPELRHRNARIGHALSTDLTEWTDLGEVLAPGPDGAFDATATWTGCVVQGDDGIWRMFYTGSVFLRDDSTANIESIGVATSHDLHDWSKQPLVLRADPRWYETLGSSDWPEEAWRDPWVFRDPDGDGWHMLVTARAREGDLYDRGVVGHARSRDLDSWEIGAPLSPTPTGFGHLEVMQLAQIEGRHSLVFSGPPGPPELGGEPRMWVVDEVEPLGPFPIRRATPLADRRLYSGRIAHDRAGIAVLLGFELGPIDGEFAGGVCDPVRLARTEGRLDPAPKSGFVLAVD